MYGSGGLSAMNLFELSTRSRHSSSMMKTSYLLVLALILSQGWIQARQLDNDPDVVYMEEISSTPMEFIVVDPAPVFASKKGGRKMGVFPVNMKVTLEAFTDKGYRVQGKGKFGLMTGWVSPSKLASKDPDFVVNLKKFYVRQLEIRKLIESREVAIGMTADEVKKSIGEPTKKESRVTKTGTSGKWEFIKFEEVKHYNYLRDPQTGETYRRYSHSTQEEKGSLEVEFESGLVSAITSQENNEPSKVKIVIPPVIFPF